MKKSIKAILSVVLVLVLGATVFAACGSKHEHGFSEEWMHDETGHWHACTGENCEEKGEFAAHTWNAGEITTPATFTSDGVKTYTCTVCKKTKTESVAFECAEVPFEKSTVTEATFTTITITDDTIGTYYFKYNVSDVSMERSEYYWIVVNKVGGILTQDDVNNCKIYDANKQTIKDTIYTQAAGQFMATREGTGEEYDDAETMAKLKAEGTHYFQMTFHTAGEYKIQVMHSGAIGSSAKWAIQTTFTTSFTSEKCSINSGNDKLFAIDLTQEIIDAINANDISGIFLDRDGNRISTVTIKAYDSEMNELRNDAIAEGETESDSVYVEHLEPGRYYICVHATATCYGYLSISVC